jgi:hypothetical protein
LSSETGRAATQNSYTAVGAAVGIAVGVLITSGPAAVSLALGAGAPGCGALGWWGSILFAVAAAFYPFALAVGLWLRHAFTLSGTTVQ